MAASQRVTSAFYAKRQAVAAKLPAIKLTGSFGAISSEVLQLQPDFSNPVGSLGASLLAPIFHAGELQAQVDIRTAEQRQAAATYGSAVLAAFRDVENALAAEQLLRERQTVLTEVVAEQTRAVAVTQTRYQVGKSDVLSVLQQRMRLYGAEATLSGSAPSGSCSGSTFTWRWAAVRPPHRLDRHRLDCRRLGIDGSPRPLGPRRDARARSGGHMRRLLQEMVHGPPGAPRDDDVRAGSRLMRAAPGLAQLLHYRKEWLGHDLAAGASVAAVALPTAIAYAEIIGLRPVVGLYAAIPPLVAYAIFGTSRLLIANPDAAVCAMVAATLAPLAAANPDTLAPLAAALALLTGLICIGAGFLNLGFVADFLAQPILVGFLNGVALQIFVGQLARSSGLPWSRTG